MTTPVKWILVTLIFMGLVLGIAYASSSQNITVRTTSEAEVLADTVAAGVIRNELNDDGKAERPIEFVNKEELAANLSANLVAVQKNHPYDVKLDYVFVDNKGQVTEIDEEIRGIQFRVQLVNDQGTVKGTAERHLTLHQLES
ncbi:hypothetical protein [Bacillus badius]|uniref:PepSY domain-containing protein n=1 Tax=Bacillus badius TaxID=1455 RepID=A0ABR5AQQ9_BACBA|nr:hypothetical protein [Bacillus badius]KIL73851.1 hypothetical protein SD78_2909 [Bacillus badius]KIL77091.1 hypothetical protein SD77_1843 [Bacillus badius]KZO00919.1 hypothetical protein A4244_14480 [Bacillus badius]MED0668055.1 hypothetical protein [Bacillus badius]MED4717834.1 hypothetical protein [Bacillus badius]